MSSTFFYSSTENRKWLVVGTPPTEARSDWPADAQDIGMPPGPDDDWNGSAWVPVTPVDEPPILSRVRFDYLMAVSGLDDVWDALMVHLKATDRTAYADLVAQRAKSQFRLDVTLDVVGTYRPQVEALLPGTDISDEAITAAWMQAALATIT